MNSIGIYIHFPFCASKCKYCNFNSYAGKNDLQLKYFQSLIKEIDIYGNKDLSVDTIFIGGGTPSIMFSGCISTLLSELKKKFNVLEDAEITIEANPNSITKSKVIEWKESGVNRVSVGLQTINPNLLKLIGRPHTRNDYINAVNIIREAGIENINTDCLIGLPRQKQSDVKKMLQLVEKLNCTHVSVYSLILEEDTPLYTLVSNGTLKLPKEEKTLGMYNYANKFLNLHGYNRYEVSNFSRENYECKHNTNTWLMHNYIGFGAGSHSFVGNKRYNNIAQIEDYIKVVGLNKKPIENEETITKNELFEETIMLGLRTKYGINLVDINTKFKINIQNTKKDTIKYFLDNGLIEIKGDILRVTDYGYPVLNKIILELVS